MNRRIDPWLLALTTLLLVLGLVMGAPVTVQGVMDAGVIPFIIPGLIKAAAVALIVPGVWQIVRMVDRSKRR